MITEDYWSILAVSLASIVLGYFIHVFKNKYRMDMAKKDAETILADAKEKAELILKKADVDSRNEVIKAREEFEKDNKIRRREIIALEERMAQREANLDRRVSMLDNKELSFDSKIADLAREKDNLLAEEKRLKEAVQAANNKLQESAQMSEEQARETLLGKVEEDLTAEKGLLIRRMQEEAKEAAEKNARSIIVTAINRYAADQVNEVTTCSVNLPNDEMKGRIIGKEGRNIRSLEAETGCNILIDDTPEVVIISGFDPMRREIARITIEQLVSDGRIHPARIEEIVAKVKEEVDDTIRQAGESAIYELGLRSVAPELLRTLGRLKYRHSFSQNVLQHSVEMAHLMGMMAAELGLDSTIAKRVGLFHDLGKAIDHTVEGSHAIIGADLLKKHGEQPIVYNAVAAHHGDVEAESLYATLAAAADAITAARPGARSETTELYLKRLKDLEEIANSFKGVTKSYAIQAGRELRVIVEPSRIDDNEAMVMARNISHHIEDKMQYPGQIKVTVIRETRCIEYAK